MGWTQSAFVVTGSSQILCCYCLFCAAKRTLQISTGLAAAFRSSSAVTMSAKNCYRTVLVALEGLEMSGHAALRV